MKTTLTVAAEPETISHSGFALIGHLLSVGYILKLTLFEIKELIFSDFIVAKSHFDAR
jgi:hypothetical protein